jgi:hypothetical protein
LVGESQVRSDQKFNPKIGQDLQNAKDATECEIQASNYQQRFEAQGSA